MKPSRCFSKADLKVSGVVITYRIGKFEPELCCLGQTRLRFEWIRKHKIIEPKNYSSSTSQSIIACWEDPLKSELLHYKLKPLSVCVGKRAGESGREREREREREMRKR